MLYLSPNCGAAGVFFAGAGFTVSISSPIGYSKYCMFLNTEPLEIEQSEPAT